MNALAVIPARFGSSRFPGKALAIIHGKTMVQRVYEQASKAKIPNKLIVATDDDRIYQHVLSFGGNVIMTNESHRSGTDRCAEISESLPEFDLIVNIQGDEPFIHPEQIDHLLKALKNEPDYEIVTLAKKILQTEQLFNPNIVKVVYDKSGKALYFSRNPIPYCRAIEQDNWLVQQNHFKHIGMYAYKRQTLLEIALYPMGKLEKAESLEQLRWLENGHAIGVIHTDQETIGIDTPADLDHVLSIYNRLSHEIDD